MTWSQILIYWGIACVAAAMGFVMGEVVGLLIFGCPCYEWFK